MQEKMPKEEFAQEVRSMKEQCARVREMFHPKLVDLAKRASVTDPKFGELILANVRSVNDMYEYLAFRTEGK